MADFCLGLAGQADFFYNWATLGKLGEEKAKLNTDVGLLYVHNEQWAIALQER